LTINESPVTILVLTLKQEIVVKKDIQDTIGFKFTKVGIWVLFVNFIITVPYITFLRLTTQESFFCWPWNASVEAQYVSGWALTFYILGIVILLFGIDLSKKEMGIVDK
jgi:hypothetical protein